MKKYGINTPREEFDMAFLQCFLVWLLPLAGHRATVGGWVGGAVEHVLCMHWGEWWDVLGLERLACPARLPGWCLFPSHELMGWGCWRWPNGWVGLAVCCSAGYCVWGGSRRQARG
ncbi:hypothetical protein ILYODFUR_023692 [Ilyodon furcidens]|uniref:Uncharacterized protein n=1 Tax=Ilyodon furcidens TaxID=33524 RepID=A0ABV0UJN3_9TELE